MPTINDLNQFESLEAFYHYLVKLGKNKQKLTFNAEEFEKKITDFFILKIQTNELRNHPDTAYKILDLIEKIRKKRKQSYSFSHARHILKQLSAEYSQKHSADWLFSILEQKGIQPMLVQPSGKHQITNDENLLPSNEYQPPEEAGHPSEIGINRTYSFKPKEIQTILQQFSTRSLKELFIHSFPWAIDPAFNKNKKADLIKKDLLDMKISLPPELQFRTIQCLLLCLDVLGKACGKEGEKSLEHLDEVRLCEYSSRQLSEHLKLIPKESHADYKKLLLQLISSLEEKSKILQKEKQLNKEMNRFCIENEKHSATLLGREKYTSVLSPKRVSRQP